MNLEHSICKLKKPDTENYRLYDPVHMKYPEQVNPARQRTDLRLLEVQGSEGWGAAM